jgi:hypothetical protein
LHPGRSSRAPRANFRQARSCLQFHSIGKRLASGSFGKGLERL